MRAYECVHALCASVHFWRCVCVMQNRGRGDLEEGSGVWFVPYTIRVVSACS